MPKKVFPLLCLYAVRCDEAIKVGITVDVPRRIHGLQNGNPVELKLAKAWLGHRELIERREWQILEALKDQKIRGEWLYCDLEQIEMVIESLHDDAAEQWLQVIPREHTATSELLKAFVLERISVFAPTYRGAVPIGMKKTEVPNYYNA